MSDYTFSQYQKEAERTINTENFEKQNRDHALFGMSSEVGEILGIFQKRYQGEPIDWTHVKKQVGDLLWFIAEFCTVVGFSMEEIAHINIEKLLKRYPDGFSVERSINRQEGDI